MYYNAFVISVSLVLSIYGSKCSRVVDVHTQRALNVSDYCPQIGECGEGSHVMCLYNSARVMGPACYDFLPNMTITPDYAHLILSITNRIRSKIANGQVKAKNGETLPKGYGMFKVAWDEELATFAQVWANQCILWQDTCRSSKKFPHVAQAVGMIRLSLHDWMPIHNREFNETTLTPAKVRYAMTQVVRAWWTMKEEVAPNDVKLYNYTSAPMLHNKFLNLIHGPVTHMGCGISVYKEYAYKHNAADLFFNCIQIVCNFSSRPKFGEPVYTVEPPKIPGYTVRCGCPVGFDEDEDCLCYRTGRKIPYSCKDKDQCKPPVVDLPIFTIEDAPATKNRHTNSQTLTTDIFDIKNTFNNRLPFNNYNDILTNLEPVAYKSDLTRRFPADVKSRYFNTKRKMLPVQNTTEAPRLLTATTYVRRHFASQKPSIFSKSRRFELPIKTRKQVTVNLVHEIKEFKKDVAPRKDFTNVQKVVSSYIDKKRHGHNIDDTDFYRDGNMSHGPVIFSDYNSKINQKLKDNKNDVANDVIEKVTYLNSFNISQDNLKRNNIQTKGDKTIMSLLDKLEEEVKNIDLNTNEKGMFDEKLRKIYDALVGKMDLNKQKVKFLRQDSSNETITGDMNFNKLSAIDQTNVDKYGFDLNKPKYNYRDFENYKSVTNNENKLGKSNGRKFFDSDTKSFTRRGNENFEERKFRNIHDVRGSVKSNHENRHLRTDDDEYYPLSSERVRYYQQKLANLQKKIKNMKNNDHPKEIPEDRHIRPVRPAKQEKQQRHRRPNDHVNSYYMPGRARFLHGF